MTISVVVIDDQPLARMRLKDLLGDIEDVECVGEAGDGDAALALIESKRPDLAFLDIQMPGLSGLDVLRRAHPRPLAVFTTAYDQHAVTAFELHALDYLLKPFARGRLEAAVDRARAALQTRQVDDQVDRVAGAVSSDTILRRVFVRKAGRILPVDLDSVEHLEARGDYVRLTNDEHSYLIRATLTDLMARLDPARFVRTHRSHAINLDHVSALESRDGRRLEVTLASGKRLVASRSRSVELRARVSL